MGVETVEAGTEHSPAHTSHQSLRGQAPSRELPSSRASSASNCAVSRPPGNRPPDCLDRGEDVSVGVIAALGHSFWRIVGRSTQDNQHKAGRLATDGPQPRHVLFRLTAALLEGRAAAERGRPGARPHPHPILGDFRIRRRSPSSRARSPGRELQAEGRPRLAGATSRPPRSAAAVVRPQASARVGSGLLSSLFSPARSSVTGEPDDAPQR